MTKTFTVTIEAEDNDIDQVDFLKNEVDAKRIRDSIESDLNISVDVTINKTTSKT